MGFYEAGLINAGAAGGEHMVAKQDTEKSSMANGKPQHIFVIVSCEQCQCCTTHWPLQQQQQADGLDRKQLAEMDEFADDKATSEKDEFEAQQKELKGIVNDLEKRVEHLDVRAAALEKASQRLNTLAEAAQVETKLDNSEKIVEMTIEKMTEHEDLHKSEMMPMSSKEGQTSIQNMQKKGKGPGVKMRDKEHEGLRTSEVMPKSSQAGQTSTQNMQQPTFAHVQQIQDEEGEQLEGLQGGSPTDPKEVLKNLLKTQAEATSDTGWQELWRFSLCHFAELAGRVAQSYGFSDEEDLRSTLGDSESDWLLRSMIVKKIAASLQ